ncbi:MAG: response regulator [Chloroflexi bacterium]|nr:response regulator [Chloroflexota bacterium]
MAWILVVDDNNDILTMFRVVLEQMGHIVGEASNGPEALRLIRREMPDLVLLDVNMPGMDGYAVLEQVRADPRVRDTRVIMITARDQPMDLVRAFELGVLFYLLKPFELGELVSRVKQALEVGQPKP